MNTRSANIGARRPNAKLNDDKVRTMRKRFKAGATVCALAHEYDVSQGNAWQVCHGHTWKHVMEEK